jgi:hypothetical protein
MIKYSKASPYSQTTSTNGYLSVMTWPDIPAQADDVPWQVTAGYMHRPDLLSYDLYRDVSYWWVFAVRNPSIIQDPVYDLVPGITIYIPKLATLKTVLGT